jgi:putative oxidoreductase
MDQTFAKFQPLALSLMRFIVGLLLLQYGIAKIFKFPVVPYFANIPPLITVAGTIELVGGALLLIGLFTRPVAAICSRAPIRSSCHC